MTAKILLAVLLLFALSEAQADEVPPSKQAAVEANVEYLKKLSKTKMVFTPRAWVEAGRYYEIYVPSKGHTCLLLVRIAPNQFDFYGCFNGGTPI